MSDKVNPKKVTGDNWETVVEFELGADQEDPVENTFIWFRTCCSIHYIPENQIAKPFYVIFGLVEMGRGRDSNLSAVLKL